jgi:hypothetical protein
MSIAGRPFVGERAVAHDRPRLGSLKAILAKLDRPQPQSGSAPPVQARDAPSAAGRRRDRGWKPYRGPPMTLGNAAAARVRLTVWSRAICSQVPLQLIVELPVTSKNDLGWVNDFALVRELTLDPIILPGPAVHDTGALLANLVDSLR